MLVVPLIIRLIKIMVVGSYEESFNLFRNFFDSFFYVVYFVEKMDNFLIGLFESSFCRES